ncbi:Thiol-disulfide isomerase or thioredoxin [Chitinophaga sp. YR627]|uniref:TlpA family protein disulfide reductase n=1 Tax=Chitinophaga sp. YR627 TaxID=1881041 RepID=UPI0008E6890E|nr:TlpA disulfide reductase family protein [Chitinophaga sp. YR627]SFM59616.1 Thiol-disulfide isomerase or thioredoxin [Chitinophaga sp. YR627]
MRAQYLVLVILLLLFSGCRAILLKKMVNQYDNRTGEQFAPIIAEDTAGLKTTVEAYQDKILYVDFWATWCAPCINMIPHHDTLVQLLESDTSIIFVNICVDKNENKARWREIIHQKDYKGRNLFLDIADPQTKSLRLDESGFPFYLLVGKGGVVLGCDLSPDEKIWVPYALLQAKDGKTVKASLKNFFKQAKRMHHHDDAETKAFVDFLDKYIIKKNAAE